MRSVAFLLLVFLVLGTHAGFAAPSCNALNNLFSKYYATDFKIQWQVSRFECPDSQTAKLARAYYDLSRVDSGAYYRTAAEMTKQTFYQAECDNGYAAMTFPDGRVYVCDKFFDEDELFRSSSLFHEAAHARENDPNHVYCQHGDVKGKLACDETLVDKLADGSGYNWQLWYLKAVENEAGRLGIDKDIARQEISFLVYNRFNTVSKEKAAKWTR